MTDATYSDTTQKCNSKTQSHENVTNNRDALASYMEDYAAWLSRASSDGQFKGCSKAAQCAELAALHLMLAGRFIRASIKEDV